jgi:hypothetical protein
VIDTEEAGVSLLAVSPELLAGRQRIRRSRRLANQLFGHVAAKWRRPSEQGQAERDATGGLKERTAGALLLDCSDQVVTGTSVSVLAASTMRSARAEGIDSIGV